MKNYSKIKEAINNADAIIIGAGAGLSTSAGINYGTTDFAKNFPELVKKYQMTDMYTSSFYEFKTEEERWRYWAKHINYLYNIPATNVYKNLYEIVKGKEYFVITTNVDGQFIKAGFAKEKVFEIQGTLSKMQCSVGCHQKLYDVLPLVKEMLKKEKDCKIPSNLVPYCPRCGEKMEINLRKDAFFVEDEHWHRLKNKYEKFIQKNKNKKIVLLELGVGFNTPSIIRFPFESITSKYEHVTLIRVNNKYPEIAFEIQNKSILVKEDCGKFIRQL